MKYDIIIKLRIVLARPLTDVVKYGEEQTKMRIVGTSLFFDLTQDYFKMWGIIENMQGKRRRGAG